MNDTTVARPDHAGLFQVASGQHGYFTAAQAREFGVGADLLSHAVKHGKYLRVHRGVYRFRDYPSHPREMVVAAWLAVGKDRAVVSHESALDLLELSNVIPDAIHLTVARSERHLHAPPGVRLHTTTRPFERGDVTTCEGIRVTAPARTIADAAETGTDPAQIELAVLQALNMGQTLPTRLERAVQDRSSRVQRLIRYSVVVSSHEKW